MTNRLATEQKQWQAQKSSREKQLATLDAQISASQSVKEELIVSIAELTGDKQAIIENIETLGKQSEHLTATIAQSEEKLEKVHEETAALEANLATKRAQVDKSIENYRQTLRKQAVDSLHELSQATETAKATLAQLEEKVRAKRDELASATEALEAAKAQNAEDEAEATKLTKELKAQIKQLEQEITTLTSKRNALSHEAASILATVKTATTEHEKFKAYETKARKILETKDAELVSRSEAISTSEQVLSNRRTFLPKM